MKTVKDYLFELNTTQLVDTYFEEYGEKLYDLYYFNSPTCEDDRHIDYDESVRDLSVYDYAQAERKAIYDFIKYLKTKTKRAIEKRRVLFMSLASTIKTIVKGGRQGCYSKRNCYLILKTAKTTALPASSFRRF